MALLPGEDDPAALFDVVSSSVRKLVGSVPFATAAVDVLEEFCAALGAQRGFIFENITEQDRTVTANEVARWSSPALGPLVADLRRERAYDDWADAYRPLLDERGVVAGPVTRVGSPEREVLEEIGARSVLAVPIRAGRRWWGYLGIHDCDREREWTSAERRAAVAIAAVLGAAVYHRPPSLDEGALQRLVEHVPAILYVDDLDDSYHSLYVGPQVEAILGIPRATWLADDAAWERHMHPDDWPRVQAEHDAYLERGGRLVQEYRMVRPDNGRVVWIRDDCTTYPGLSGESGVIQGVMTDVTEQKELEEQVQFLAYHDVLTGLSNRAMFEKFLGLALTRARRAGTSVALLYVDLDGLKLVNDTFGHQAGDELLSTVAQRLSEATRTVDLVARHGGDEFLVMLPDLPRSREDDPSDEPPVPNRSVAAARAIADRICQAVRQPTYFGETEYQVSASVGISMFPDDADDIRTLLKHADEAMYQSKQHSRGEATVYGDAT